MGAEYPSVGGCGCQSEARHLFSQRQNASMEALEFLAALFIVITLPEETSDKQSRNVSKDEISFQQDLISRPLEVGSHFKVGGMWLGKSFQFK